jgi:uncharacterized membrane protein YuzA (DUF378 family)
MATMDAPTMERRHLPERRAAIREGSAAISAIDYIAMALLIVGGLNWAMVGLFDVDVVATLFRAGSPATRLIYVLVGISALYSIFHGDQDGSQALTHGLAMRIGLISDTHGLLRPEALDFLAGSDHIVHGGDIGGPDILERLAALAPLTVVRGNNDTAGWAASIPATARVEFGGVALYAIHDLKELDIDPQRRRARGAVGPLAQAVLRRARRRALRKPRQRRPAPLQPADHGSRTPGRWRPGQGAHRDTGRALMRRKRKCRSIRADSADFPSLT